MKPVDVIEVLFWGKRVGATTADRALGCYAFEYEPAWKRRDSELAPLTMPLSDRRQTFTFPALPKLTYFGLPAMLADALPDDFGNALIDAWMATKGIEKSSVTILDRLAYMGKRGTGALEFRPARGSHTESSAPIEMKQLVEEARRLVQGSFAVDHEAKAALANIIKVGTSAGGARAKAVIAWNPETDEVRSGQFDTAPGFEHWLLKFDGVGKDKELGTGEGYTLHHYRDKDQDEVDIVVENEQGALVGIEVKASATVHANDFKGMRKLLDNCGDDLKLGLVLYDGMKVVPFGDRLFAAPMSCLWT